MKPFMDQDFLLNTETAKKLYHEAAAGCPILDYHCHINPREIYEDRRYENITQVWLGADHYKWRLMRSAGVPEYFITGGAGDLEKFQKFAEVLSKSIGNPVYHWSHLELQRFFGYYGVLSPKTADEVWALAQEKLKSDGYSARGLIRQSNVALICTTDDPLDTLEWHQKLFKEQGFATKVLPAWRPDKAMNIEKPDFADYLRKLGAVAGVPVTSFESLKAALRVRLQYFKENRCSLSDHALDLCDVRTRDRRGDRAHLCRNGLRAKPRASRTC